MPRVHAKNLKTDDSRPRSPGDRGQQGDAQNYRVVTSDARMYTWTQLQDKENEHVLFYRFLTMAAARTGTLHVRDIQTW